MTLSNITSRWSTTFATAILLTSLILGNTAHATDTIDVTLPKPKSLTVDKSLDKKTAESMIQAARLFYAFWNTGEAKYAQAAVAPSFFDNTLPKGRPQGTSGLLSASRNFRTAVPDLHCTIDDLLVVGDKVVARLTFTGTHKGGFMGKPASGKQVNFLAIDILHMKDGRIVENWHLEDNLTLLQQLGAVPAL